MNDTIKTPFDSLTLRAVSLELRVRLIGGQIQDIRQPSPSEILIGIRSQGKNWVLLLCDDARFARVHLTSQKRPNAPIPPTFCMSLRKHLEGCPILEIRQRGFDRVLEIVVNAWGEDGERTPVTLIAELMGKHSNLILVNERGNVLEAAKRITKRVSRFREILPGQPYLPPPEQEGRLDPFSENSFSILRAFLLDSLDATPEEISDFLMQSFAGMSPFLARELRLHLLLIRESAETSDSQLLLAKMKSEWESLFTETPGFQPTLISQGGSSLGTYPMSLLSIPADLQSPAPDLNLTLDSVYRNLTERTGLSAISGELKGQIERDIRRFAKQKEAAEKALEEAGKAEAHKQTGELILANLWQIEAGAKEIEVQDYFLPDFPFRTLKLDPERSPKENAEACFKRYRKSRDGEESALERSVETQEKLKVLREAKAALANWESAGIADETLLQKLKEGLKSKGLLRQQSQESDEKKTGPDFQGHRIKRFTTPEGYEIYIGESATANDFLTLRLASPNDWWLHVRAATSSHVVIKSQGKPELVPPGVLRQAAMLCAKHSSQKHSSLVSVDLTLKKYVRKPRGAEPGSANYQNERTLEVTPDA